jgi:adenylate kinase
MTIILFGPPGCGKGTQSALIAEKYKLKHISTGDILRNEMEMKTELGLAAKSYVNEGKLVPDNVIIDMLINAICHIDNNLNGVLLDGFPRTTAQAEALELNLTERNKQTNVLIDLQVDDQELVERMLLRGQMTGRIDDNPETIKKRLQVYMLQTYPVKTFYQQLNKYVSVEGVGEIEQIFNNICEEIDKHYHISTE